MSGLPPLFSPSPSPSVTPSIDSPTSRTTPASTMPAAGPTSAASDRKQLTQPHEQTDPLLEFAQTTSAFANNGILSVQSAAAKAAQSVKAHVPDVSAQALKSGPHFLSALSDMSRSGFVTIFKIASTPLPAGDSGEEAPDASWREHSASSADRMQWQKATGAGVPDIANSSFGTYEGTTKATMHVAGKTATSPVILTGTTDGAVNRAQHEVYVDTLRAGMQKPIVSDPKLNGLVEDIFRRDAKVGNGSTGAAVREELRTGLQTGGRFHSQKAEDYSRALQKWLKSNPTARLSDRAAAENMLRDMQNALHGK